MREETRTSLTGLLWIVSAIALGALFISAAIMGGFTIGHGIFGTIIFTVAIVATPFILRYKDDDADREKAKRERIDNIIRDMSDEELVELKHRLSDGDLSDETIMEYLSDDGEMVMRN